MLRTFFFVLSLLTDYRGVSDALHAGAVSGAVNTAAFLALMVCAYFRRTISHRVEQRARR